ncbi:MAG: LytR C-terminal domain-containing protein [Mycobacterium sp.]
MNQRDSSGLPLRAMIMVLLFLGVVFLLVGFQAIGSGDDDDSSSASSTTTTSATSTAPPTSSEAEAARPQVRVFNVSDVAGAGENVATRLRDEQWDVPPSENLVLNEPIPETTVYYGSAPEERTAAEEIGGLLEVPVAERTPELAEQPPGVIVLVTG